MSQDGDAAKERARLAAADPLGHPRRVRLALAPLATVAAVLVAACGGIATPHPATPSGSAPATAPGTAAAGGPLPISTGSPVLPPASGQASAPGPTVVLPADSVPLSPPIFAFSGSGPWQIQASSTPGTVLEGYASRPSYLPGDTIRLAVSTTAPSYDLTIWRVSGRAAIHSPFVLVASARNEPGRLQPAPSVDPTTRMVTAHWAFTYSFPIPTSWPSGVYLVRLASSEQVQAYVPFVVRSPTAHSVLVVTNALTWQAYNEWGGSSMYKMSVGEPAPGVGRALGVSFDRPYADEDGAGQLFFLELPFISWVERQGLDVSFTTDYDLSIDPAAQPLPRVVVFDGHSEYWGVPLYDWLDSHVSAGDLGVAMFAADSSYWPISFGRASADGPHDFVCLKGGPVPQAWLPAGQTPEPSEPVGATSPPGDVEEPAAPGYQSIGPAGAFLGSFPGEPLFGVRYQGSRPSSGATRSSRREPTRGSSPEPGSRPAARSGSSRAARSTASIPPQSGGARSAAPTTTRSRSPRTCADGTPRTSTRRRRFGARFRAAATCSARARSTGAGRSTRRGGHRSKCHPASVA